MRSPRHTVGPLALVILVCTLGSLSTAQTIRRIGIKKTSSTSDAAEFEMVIFGEQFGTTPGSVAVALAPTTGILRSPSVTDLSGERIVVRLSAAPSYVPRNVTVTTAAGGVAHLRLPYVDGTKLLTEAAPAGNQAKYVLQVSGSGFLAPPEKISILLMPDAGLTSKPEVVSISADGTSLEARFEASRGYRPSKLIVTVDGAESQQTEIGATPETGGPNGEIRMYRAIMEPKVVHDVFGRRIAKRFVVVQVVVANRNKEFQYLLHDLSMDLTRIRRKWSLHKYELSSQELTLLRGVAERGQQFGPRNLSLRILRGAGTIAGGIIGVAKFGPAFAPAVAAFSGPLLSAFQEVFPDTTINQLNRLNDSAYAANALIGRQQARVFVVFLPMSMFMTRKEQKRFRDNPAELFSDEEADLDLRRIEVVADGVYIAELPEVAPSITQVVIEPSQLKGLQDAKPKVKGYIAGQWLGGASVALVGTAPPGLTISDDGTATGTRLNFILGSDQPVPPDTVIELEVSHDGKKTRTLMRLEYTPEPPVLSSVQLAEGKPGEPVTIKAAGTGFVPGITRLEISGTDVKIVAQEVTAGLISATLDIDPKAEGDREVIAVTSPGGRSSPQKFRIKKPGTH